MAERTDRRCFLARGVAGAAGIGAAYGSIEENTLLAAMKEGETGASPGTAGKTPKTDIPPGSLPRGKICGIPLSRIFIGGNLIGGWAHSRDLMYASKLFTSYNTEAKVFETLELCQACGINTIQLDPLCWPVVTKFNQHHSTKMQTMVCVSFSEDKAKTAETIKRQVDLGATFIYSHGGMVDSFMMSGGKVETMAQFVDLVKAQGVPAGMGGHSLNVPMTCEKNKVNPDFYVKTFHMDRYWSATPKEHRKEYDWMRGSGDHNLNNDNMWCNNPEETAAFMATVEKPWVAFKVMAAGAINPHMAFPYTYRHGADFIIAGMFDFQVEADVKIAIQGIQQAKSRRRPWRA